jgi:hypothetical protein
MSSEAGFGVLGVRAVLALLAVDARAVFGGDFLAGFFVSGMGFGGVAVFGAIGAFGAFGAFVVDFLAMRKL